MNLRAPEAFIRVNVAHPAKDALVEQQTLDHRAPAGEARAEFCLGDLKRIEAQRAEKSSKLRLRHESQAAEAADIRVAQLAAVVEHEKSVRVQRHRLFSAPRRELTGHPQMHDEAEATAGTVLGLEM